VLTVAEQVDLSGYTTLRLGGPAARFVTASTADAVAEAVRGADLAGESLLVLGGGSNLVIADEGFPGTVVRIATTGVGLSRADDAGDVVLLTVAAGEDWDRLVEWTVDEKLAGIECLSGIPGLAGATPIQNVGAYGQEVATTIESVLVLDRAHGGAFDVAHDRARGGAGDLAHDRARGGAVELASDRTAALRTLTRADCGFGYRTSVFKADQAAARRGFQGVVPLGQHRTTDPTGRYVVLEVTFALRRQPMSASIRYPELAAALGVAIGEQAPLADVRSAVLGLRRRKGMVLDPADHDTVSAGSFFTNPVIGPDQLARLEGVVQARTPGAGVPSYPAERGQFKIPAAWLIEQAGFAKGYPGTGPARISSKHTLALTNHGGASTSDMLELAQQITAGVRAAFDIKLITEPVLVGVRL
jgi:UDP-N-acetylmuramate dehydrogenase